MKYLTLLFLALVATASAQTVNVPVPPQQCMATCTTPATTVPYTPPVVIPPPPPNAAWVYYNGVFNWSGTFNYAGAASNFRDTSGVPLSGGFDIAWSNGGGFQPYYNAGCALVGGVANNSCFDLTPYTAFVIAIKPTATGQVWGLGLSSAGDTPDGAYITDISPYGPAVPVVGQWNVYKVPLSAFSLTTLKILKWRLQNQSSVNATSLTYLDNAGFQ